MLKAETISKLSPRNIVHDPVKSKERFGVAWRKLEGSKRNEIMALCGLKKTTIERAYSSGSVSAKITAAFSQVLELDPLYLIGASDEQREFTDKMLVDFLTDLGFKIGVKEKRKYNRKQSTDKVTAQAATHSATATDSIDKLLGLDAVLAKLKETVDAGVLEKISNLTDDELMMLFKSLNVKAGISDAKKDHANLIKFLLFML